MLLASLVWLAALLYVWYELARTDLIVPDNVEHYTIAEHYWKFPEIYVYKR